MASLSPSTDPRTRTSLHPSTTLDYEPNKQALTLSILLGWTSYVISLSQAGKSSPLGALGDAIKGAGKGDAGLMSGQTGLGVFGSIAGGQSVVHTGTVKGVLMIATAAYTITFGILGFIPAPSVGRKD